jgi:predicted membrane protein
MQVPSPPHPHRRLWPDHRRHERADTGVTDFGRVWLGATILALGVVLLLDAAGVLDAGRAIGRWWPLAIVAAGLLTLAERPPAVTRGLILTAVGALLLLFSTDVLGDDAWAYVWPSLLIAAGIVIIARWQGRAVTGSVRDEDVVRATAVFGGPDLVCSTQHFKGAFLTAVFGGITLDLRDARPAPEGATITATTAFGGVDLLVPKGWRLSVRSTPIFGGLSDKTDHAEPLPDDAPTLRIDAITIFGGVDIKNDKKD